MARVWISPSPLGRGSVALVQTRADRACSWHCFTQALAADVCDTQGGTTREGIYLGATAGTIDLAERCYLGVETRDDGLWLHPVLPAEITRLAATLTYRGHRLDITATHTELTITTSDVTTDDTGRDTGGAAIAPIIVRTSARDLYLDGGHHSAAIPVRASAGAPGHPRARR